MELAPFLEGDTDGSIPSRSHNQHRPQSTAAAMVGYPESSQRTSLGEYPISSTVEHSTNDIGLSLEMGYRIIQPAAERYYASFHPLAHPPPRARGGYKDEEQEDEAEGGMGLGLSATLTEGPSPRDDIGFPETQGVGGHHPHLHHLLHHQDNIHRRTPLFDYPPPPPPPQIYSAQHCVGMGVGMRTDVDIDETHERHRYRHPHHSSLETSEYPLHSESRSVEMPTLTKPLASTPRSSLYCNDETEKDTGSLSDVPPPSTMANGGLEDGDLFTMGIPGNDSSEHLADIVDQDLDIDLELELELPFLPRLPNTDEEALSTNTTNGGVVRTSRSRERSVSSTPISHNKTQNRPKKKSKMHECEVCHKLFPRPSGLQTHMNTHTDSKPYPCGVQGCTKRFAVRSNAKRHLRTHGILPPTHSSTTATRTPTINEYEALLPYNHPGMLPTSSADSLNQYRQNQQQRQQRQHQLGASRTPVKAQWVPHSLMTRTNVRSLQPCQEGVVDEVEYGGGGSSGREMTNSSLTPALPLPLRPVVPSLPTSPDDEFFEERDSYLPTGSHPYHSSQFRGLPGPAPPLQAVY